MVMKKLLESDHQLETPPNFVLKHLGIDQNSPENMRVYTVQFRIREEKSVTYKFHTK